MSVIDRIYYSITYTPEQIKILCSLADVPYSKNTTFTYSRKVYPKLKLLKFINGKLTINSIIITKITARVQCNRLVVNFYNGKKIILNFNPSISCGGIFVNLVKNNGNLLLLADISEIVSKKRQIVEEFIDKRVKFTI